MKSRTDFVIMAGQNLPNHSESLAGRAKFVRISGHRVSNTVPLVRTREEAYRLAANLIATAQCLPNEEEVATWDDILDLVLEETNTQLDAEEVNEDGNPSDKG